MDLDLTQIGRDQPKELTNLLEKLKSGMGSVGIKAGKFYIDPTNSINRQLDRLSEMEYEGIEAPDFLTTMSKEGLGREGERALYLKDAIPMGEQANVASRQARAGFSRTGLKGGFQEQVQTQIEREKESALSQLLVGVENQSETARQEAIERLAGLDQFNKSMQMQFEQWQQGTALDLYGMKQDYELAERQRKAQEDASSSSAYGSLVGTAASLLFGGI